MPVTGEKLPRSVPRLANSVFDGHRLSLALQRIDKSVHDMGQHCSGHITERMAVGERSCFCRLPVDLIHHKFVVGRISVEIGDVKPYRRNSHDAAAPFGVVYRMLGRAIVRILRIPLTNPPANSGKACRSRRTIMVKPCLVYEPRMLELEPSRISLRNQFRLAPLKRHFLCFEPVLVV